MNKQFIELRNISKSFFGNKVLDKIDFSVASGEVLCLAGENGSGKSTIIKIISGVYEHDEGEIIINGKPFDKISPVQSINEGIQVIYQDFSVFPNLTVAENIGLSYHLLMKKRMIDWKRGREIARESLDKIGVELDLDMDVGELSVAQKQIVAISRAILYDAKLIIMDEPTTALSRREILRLYEIIDKLKKKNIAVIFVSHKLDEVFSVSDRIVVVRNGKKVIDEKTEKFEKEKLSFYMTGKHICESPFSYEKKDDKNVLRVENLGSRNCFEDISFEIFPGEILAVTGQLGSGRTELAEALFGIHPIDKGTVLLERKKISVKSIPAALKYGISYIPEDRLREGLFLEMTITHNVVAALIKKLTTGLGILDKKRIRKLSKDWIEKLEVKVGSIDAVTGSLSGGNQQRVVLAKWLATEPKVLILNCPTVGVDIKSKSEIHAIIKELAGKGIATLLISDDINEILANSNRILVMNKGKQRYSLQTKDTAYDDLSSKITED